MAQITFRSAGVSARTIDLTGPTAIQPLGIPAGVISTTPRGPAFVPKLVATLPDYTNRFGFPTENMQNGPLSAVEWLRTQQSYVQLRVLGAGDATARTTNGQNKGKVNNAGFVVGDNQPQVLLTGSLSSNTYANALSTSPNATGSAGRTYLLGCFMSQSANSTLFTDAGLPGLAVPVVRGVLFAASGVLLRLSTSTTASEAPTSTRAADLVAGTAMGALTGNLDISSGKQEFVMLLYGHKGTDATYPNVITASFDPTAANYFANTFNKNPYKYEQAGHLLYSWFDIHPNMAVPSGSGIVAVESGSTGIERIAFLLTGSQARNSGSTTVPNYENFEDRYRTASTPWIISQKFGGTAINLFKLHALDDGEYPNGRVKISIENIAPSNTTAYQYGSFDVVVRDFNDIDTNRVILEQWRNITLDPQSDRYIARVIGDGRKFYNFDATAGNQGVIEDGEFSNQSLYVRVELSQELVDGTVDETALPMGFRGPQHLVTSGSAPMPSLSDNTYYLVSKNNIFNNLVQPPVPLRKNILRGTSPNQTVDRTLYWGVQFEQLTSALEPNASYRPNSSLVSFAKYYPNFQTEWQNFAIRDNTGAADTAANGIIDADRFNYNAFSLENIQIKYVSSNNLPDLSNITSWTYVRNGQISLDTTNLLRAMTVSDLLDPGTRGIAKFTIYLEGGFDGTRLFNRDARYLTNNAVYEEMLNSNRGGQSGPSVSSYVKALDVMGDTLETDIQLLTVPGIRHRFISDTATNVAEVVRGDCMYIMDIEEKDTNNNDVTDPSTQSISVTNTANNFRSRGLNSSYAAAYFPDVNIRDPFTQNVVRVPPSVAVLGAYGKNDAVSYPWFAAAGFTRGAMPSVQNIALELNRSNLDTLYPVNINPLVSFSNSGPIVWGQKTTLATQSAFNRANVRRLLISLRRQVQRVSDKIMFEPAIEETIEQFNSLVAPILKKVQDENGVQAYQVNIDTSTTSQADLENKIIRGKLFIQPSRSLEFFSIDFVLTNRGNFVT